MITIPSPTSKRWIQANSGDDILGNIYATRNISFSQKAYLSLAPRTKALYTDLLDVLLSVVYFATPAIYVIITANKIFHLTSDLNTMTIDVASGVPTPSDYGDGCIYNGRVYVSSTNAVKYLDSALAWQDPSISLTSSVPHALTVFESLNYLAVGNGNTVRLYDTSHALITTLTIPSYYEITWLIYRESELFIGTRNVQGGEAKMFVWNGDTSEAQKAFGCQAEWIFSGCEYDNSIAITTSTGQVLRYNGGGFDELANLPVYYTDSKWYSTNYGYLGGKVVRRGMLGIGKLLYIVLDGRLDDDPYYLENQPSGLWIFEPDVGFSHFAGRNSEYVSSGKTVSSVDAVADTATISTTSTVQTGTAVFSSGTVGGVPDGIYYAIRVDSTHFKLARTITDALAGTAVNMSTTTTGKFYMAPLDKFGESGLNFQNGIGGSKAGAISKIRSLSSTNFFGYGIVFGACNIATSVALSGSGTSALETLSYGENRGTVTLQKIFSPGIEDNWNAVCIRGRNLYNTNDKIYVKYRTEEREGFPIINANQQLTAKRLPITWASQTTFTSLQNEFGKVEDGDEITFLAGSGAGFTVHISGTPVLSSGVYTVTVDETMLFVTAGDTADVSIQNWTKLGYLAYSDTGLYKKFSIGKNSKWIQFKLELRGVDTALEDIQIINKPHLANI